jgi:hypothetical protein
VGTRARVASARGDFDRGPPWARWVEGGRTMAATETTHQRARRVGESSHSRAGGTRQRRPTGTSPLQQGLETATGPVPVADKPVG